MLKKGLNDQQVRQSREKYGNNVIPDSEPTTFWAEFKETFSDPMIKILLFIAGLMVIMFFLGYAEIYEPIGTVVAVLIVAFVTAKTGVASDTKYRELKNSTKKDVCKVYRNSMVTVIEVDDVVVGDKVLLQSGDKIPADGILVEGDLRVDNSALNGEAEECKKTATDVSTEMKDEITGDTFVDKYSLFRGAVVFDGTGILDVRKVGLKTMMGKMAEEMQEDEVDSPLKVKLGKLAHQISTFGYMGAVVIAIFYMVYFVLSAGGIEQYLAMCWTEILKNVIEKKGTVLTQMSKFWFDMTEDIVPNHMISVDVNDMPEFFRQPKFDGNSMMCKKLEMLPIECIVRGYITGSGWASYQENGTVCGIKLPEGLKESDKLPEPIYTPSTKAEIGDHDENISYEESIKVLEKQFPGKGEEYAAKLKEYTIALYKKCADYALERGIIIADTKFEFGLDENGNIVIGDEMLTPDSSRFWPADVYEPGHGQPSFDKQFARDWLKANDNHNWTLPKEVEDKTIAIYLEGYEKIDT